MAIRAVRNVFWIDRLGLLSSNLGHRDNPLHCPDVRQLRSTQHDVTNGVDAGLDGLHPAIDLDEAAVGFDLGSLQTNIFCARLAPNSNQNSLGLQFFLLAVNAY